MGDIEKAVQYMEQIANDNSHGYDQTHRGGNPDFDCSSLVGHAMSVGGFNVNPNSTTRNLRAQFLACGLVEIPVDAPRQRGDIFLKEGYHVVMCVDASRIVHASINEKGRTTGGKSGDQTGKEICIRDFYNYKGGWQYHFRYTQTVSTPVPVPAPTPTPKPVTMGGYNVGSEYTLQEPLYIRDSANGNKVGWNAISQDARNHAHISGGHPVLNAGTVVTCKGVEIVGGATWLHIPSGWVCAVTANGDIYIR